MSGIPTDHFGPGAMPDGEQDIPLDFMELPKDMRTYSAPMLPERDEVSGIEPALAVLQAVCEAAAMHDIGHPSKTFDITHLDTGNRAFVDQALGDGEVSIVGGATIQVQESVLAGIWRVHETDITGALLRDSIEIGSFPVNVLEIAEAGTLDGTRSHRGPLPEGVQNAPALVTELDDKIAAYTPATPAHVINLTLLPLSDEDATFLDDRLGPGTVTILSRGYGNCRISSTGTRNVWWVRYFNSRDTIVLNTIEVVNVPNVACAAGEDLKDSAQRLEQILGVYA